MSQLVTRHTAPRRTVFLVTLLAFVFLLLCAVDAAQEPANLDDAPPPIKQLSKEEKQSLAGETNLKGRTALSLELMNKRMENAESLNAAKHFDDMFKELGGFNALMDDALRFLVEQDKDKGKVLYNFKRLDIGLRAFLPRLEVIRRDLPDQYEPYVQKLIKFIGDAREKALEPMFGKTVVPDRPDH